MWDQIRSPSGGENYPANRESSAWTLPPSTQTPAGMADQDCRERRETDRGGKTVTGSWTWGPQYQPYSHPPMLNFQPGANLLDTHTHTHTHTHQSPGCPAPTIQWFDRVDQPDYSISHFCLTRNNVASLSADRFYLLTHHSLDVDYVPVSWEYQRKDTVEKKT